MLHLIRRHPTRCIELRLDLLTTHLLSDVGNAHPKHTNRRRSVTRLIVDCELNLVRLVDIDVERFVLPPVDACRLCPSLDGILHFQHNERLGTSGEPRAGGMVDVLHGVDAEG